MRRGQTAASRNFVPCGPWCEPTRKRRAADASVCPSSSGGDHKLLQCIDEGRETSCRVGPTGPGFNIQDSDRSMSRGELGDVFQWRRTLANLQTMSIDLWRFRPILGRLRPDSCANLADVDRRFRSILVEVGHVSRYLGQVGAFSAEVGRYFLQSLPKSGLVAVWTGHSHRSMFQSPAWTFTGDCSSQRRPEGRKRRFSGGSPNPRPPEHPAISRLLAPARHDTKSVVCRHTLEAFGGSDVGECICAGPAYAIRARRGGSPAVKLGLARLVCGPASVPLARNLPPRGRNTSGAGRGPPRLGTTRFSSGASGAGAADTRLHNEAL